MKMANLTAIFFLLLISSLFSQNLTSYYEIPVRSKSTGKLVTGLDVDLYQSGVKKYDLSESTTTPGVYFHATVAVGEYDIYVNTTSFKTGVFIGANKLSEIAKNWKFGTNDTLDLPAWHVKAQTFEGSGALLTGITGATGGVANTNNTTVGADTDADGVGVIALQTRAVDRLKLDNLGNLIKGKKIQIDSEVTQANLGSYINSNNIVDLPEKTYYIASGIALQIQNKNNVKIMGEGAKTLFKRDSVDAFVAYILNCDTVVIENVAFEGGIFVLDSCKYVVLRNVIFRNSGGNNVLVRYCDFVKFDGCISMNSQFHNYEINSSRDIDFEGCFAINSNAGKNYEIWESELDNSPSERITLRGCHGTGGVSGLIIHASHNNVITACTFYNDSTYSVIIDDSSRNNILSNNIFHSSNAGYVADVNITIESDSTELHGNKFLSGLANPVIIAGGSSVIGQYATGKETIHEITINNDTADSAKININGAAYFYNTTTQEDVFSLGKSLEASKLWLHFKNGILAKTDWRIGTTDGGGRNFLGFHYANGAISTANNPGLRTFTLTKNGSAILAGSNGNLTVTNSAKNFVFDTESTAADTASIVFATSTTQPELQMRSANGVGLWNFSIDNSDIAYFQNASGGYLFQNGNVGINSASPSTALLEVGSGGGTGGNEQGINIKPLFSGSSFSVGLVVYPTWTASQAVFPANIYLRGQLDGAYSQIDYYGINIDPITLNGGASLTNFTGVYVNANAPSTNDYCFVGVNGFSGFGTSSPTSYVDVSGDVGYAQFRLRSTYTPTSTSDANGNTGDIAWDSSYIYIKTSAGWKRTALVTF